MRIVSQFITLYGSALHCHVHKILDYIGMYMSATLATYHAVALCTAPIWPVMNIYCLLPNLLQYKFKLTTRSHQFTHTTCAVRTLCMHYTHTVSNMFQLLLGQPPTFHPCPHMNHLHPHIWARPTVQLLVTRHKLDQMSVSRILRIQLSKINCKIKSIFSHMGSTF